MKFVYIIRYSITCDRYGYGRTFSSRKKAVKHVNDSNYEYKGHGKEPNIPLEVSDKDEYDAIWWVKIQVW